MKYLVATFAFASVSEAQGFDLMIVQVPEELSSRNSFFSKEVSSYLTGAIRVKFSYIDTNKWRSVVKLVPVSSLTKNKKSPGAFRVRSRRKNFFIRSQMYC
ncbi:hypothetical protein [Bartonella sp. CB175]|uniref:hypothetical protein n=1 Tax=Bartonella sp. CB175 TaxID=3112256 RepID=UPI00300DF0E5